MYHANFTSVEPRNLLGRQLPDVGFCFEGDTYGSRFGCFDKADGKDCADSYNGDVFVYGWALLPSSRNCFGLGVQDITRKIEAYAIPPPGECWWVFSRQKGGIYVMWASGGYGSPEKTGCNQSS